jgi:hypothetical protein
MAHHLDGQSREANRTDEAKAIEKTSLAGQFGGGGN